MVVVGAMRRKDKVGLAGLEGKVVVVSAEAGAGRGGFLRELFCSKSRRRSLASWSIAADSDMVDLAYLGRYRSEWVSDAWLPCSVDCCFLFFRRVQVFVSVVAVVVFAVRTGMDDVCHGDGC